VMNTVVRTWWWRKKRSQVPRVRSVPLYRPATASDYHRVTSRLQLRKHVPRASLGQTCTGSTSRSATGRGGGVDKAPGIYWTRCARYQLDDTSQKLDRRRRGAAKRWRSLATMHRWSTRVRLYISEMAMCCRLGADGTSVMLRNGRVCGNRFLR
jgi:hypothetical protein